MPNTQIPDGLLAALNDNELEILRLLASGHTAKSIAARLGRSETAINERLREARRKTGVGSSRELARLLDAQKIWDKNIDLAAKRPSREAPDQPRSKGFDWTKGRIAMLIALPAALLGLSVSAITASGDTDTAQVAPSVASPLAGTWELDVSRIPDDERPHSVTIAFAESSDGKWTSHVDIVERDGTTRVADSTARTDGVAVPVTGTMAFIDTVSLRQPDAGTLIMTLGKDGKLFATRVYTVSDDGQRMTETIIWPGKGIPKMENTRFNRIG